MIAVELEWVECWEGVTFRAMSRLVWRGWWDDPNSANPYLIGGLAGTIHSCGPPLFTAFSEPTTFGNVWDEESSRTDSQSYRKFP